MRRRWTARCMSCRSGRGRRASLDGRLRRRRSAVPPHHRGAKRGDGSQRQPRQRIACTRSTRRCAATGPSNWPRSSNCDVESCLIPSHPMAGRICTGGVVFVNGVPVADSELGNDPRLPVRSSRPSESLPGTELAGPGALEAWLAQSTAGVAIVDATTLAEIDQLVAIALGAADVVVSGPASVVGAVAGIWCPGDAAVHLPDPWLPEPVVVVCASLHPVSRAQIAKVAEAGIDVVTSSRCPRHGSGGHCRRGGRACPSARRGARTRAA